MSGIGLVLQAAGAASSAIGAYYQAKSNQYLLRSSALDEEFKGTVADMNARSAEMEAQGILAVGQQQIGALTAEAGAVKASARAGAAARGVAGGVGNAAEQMASLELAKRVDMATVNRNTIRAAGQARLQAVDFRNQASFSRLSARDLRASAKAISPGAAVVNSFLGNSAQLASGAYQWSK